MNASLPARTARTKAWGRLALSLTLLIATLAWLSPQRLWSRFQQVEPGALVLSLLIASLAFPLLAARWSFLSTRAGAPLGFRSAIRQYYVSTLLNQLLPLGVAGDAWRALRQLETHSEGAARAQVLPAFVADRASGQLVLWLWVIALLPSAGQHFSAARSWDLELSLAVVVAAALVVVLAWRRKRLREWLRTGTTLLVTPRSAIVHVPLSLALLAVHVATFWASARALGLGLDAAAAFRIVPLVLCVGSLPAFFAGWGVREAAAAGLYHLSGMSSGDGASASLLFGLVGLMASAPGIFLLEGPQLARR